MASPAARTKASDIVEIERLNIPYSEVARYDLTQLDLSRRVQVRESKNYNPREQVERFAIQMGEVEFPPIVVTDDAWIVDGNTRIAAKAYRREKFKDDKFFPAIVLGVSWSDASEKRKDELEALAATLNSKAGVPLTASERRTVASKLIANNWKSDQIARAIGLSTGMVTQVRQEIEARARLKKVGFNNGHMRGASLRALGKAPVLTLNDKPFRELADIATVAGLNASEIVTFAKEAKETGSDDGAIAKLNALRSEMRERIKEQALTGAAKPPVARQLRQHLGFVTKWAGNEGVLVETNPDVAEQHVQVIEAAIAVLKSVLAAQSER